MRTVKGLFLLVLTTLVLMACRTTPDVPVERLGTVREPLIARGGRCLTDNQCETGFCVDTVCCNDACGFGARDARSCSNVYGVVPGLVEGTCTDLVPGNPCGSLVSFNPCAWRGSTINGGGNCPAPGNEQTFACQACTSSAQCPAGLPVCIANGCTACTADYSPGSTNPTACPTAAAPACVNGACLECTETNTSACTGTKGSCDTTINECVGCSGNFGSAPSPTNKFPCSAEKPACLPSGACAECNSNEPTVPVTCTKDPNKTVCDLATNVCVNCVTSATCPSAAPVCTNKTCTPCNGNFGSAASSKCPTAAMPACVPQAGPGTCEQCSASDTSACALVPGKPVCDVTTNACVQCNVGADCAGTPLTPFCNNHVCTSNCLTDDQCTAPGATKCKNGLCVQCIDNGQCGGATPFCDTARNVCVGCLTSANCTGPDKPVCSALGTCVKCDGDNGTAATHACPTAAAPACNIATGVCVQCNAGNTGLCTGSKPVCNTATNQCVECTTSANCVATGPRPVCNTSNGTCAACNADRGAAGTPPATLACPLATAPACVAGSCVECKDGPGGTNTSACTPGEPVCKNATNECVQCLSSVQCLGSNGVCNVATNTCVPGCTTDANCSFPLPKCKTATNQCVQCLDSAQCAAPTPICNTTTNQCIECSTNAQCGGATPSCSNGKCVPCDGDLGSGSANPCTDAASPACAFVGPDAGKCVQCTNANTTACAGDKPACNVNTNTCVECSSNAQCSGAKPICSAAGVCVPCNGDRGSNTSASCPTVTEPACLTAGPNVGDCVECSAVNTSACTSAKPVCDVAANVCVQCNTSAECTGTNGKCNTTTHTCTLGCSSDANCSSAFPVCKLPEGICVECAAGKTQRCTGTVPICDEPTNTCVRCLATADCPGDAPVCNPVTKVCQAECTASSECPGNAPICNPTTKRCVPCTEDAHCPASAPVCDPATNLCVPGCTKSSECPGSTPVCNPTTKKCVECTESAQCPGDKPVCDPVTGTCGTTCTKSSECPGSTPVCNPTTKKCVQCAGNADCPASAPICDPATGTCKPNVDAGSPPEPPVVLGPTIPVDDGLNIQGGGCGCKTVPTRSDTVPMLVGLGLGLTVIARRRRR